MKIYSNLYTVKVKWGGRYVSPRGYKDEFWSLRDIPEVIRDIEADSPKFKGKCVVFQQTLEETNFS